MTTTIRALGGNGPIQATCAIRYRGYTVSISTITEPAEVLVYHDATGEGAAQYPATAGGITQAFSLVDDLITQAFQIKEE